MSYVVTVYFVAADAFSLLKFSHEEIEGYLNMMYFGQNPFLNAKIKSVHRIWNKSFWLCKSVFKLSYQNQVVMNMENPEPCKSKPRNQKKKKKKDCVDCLFKCLSKYFWTFFFFFLIYYKTTSCPFFSLNASGTMYLFGSFKEMKTGSHYRKIKAIHSQTLIHFLALRLWLTVYKFNTIFRVLQHPEGIFTNVAAFHTFADLANDRNAFCK